MRREIVRLGAPRAAVEAAEMAAMKPEAAARPFDRQGWVFELKYDGFRLLAAKRGDAVKLSYRSGKDATRILPEIARAVAALPFASLVLDGEVVVLDETGRPSFQRLQRRALKTRALDAGHAAAANPAAFIAFDLLECEGFDLRPLPLLTRKALLRRVLPADGPLRYLDHIAERGKDLYAAVAEMGLEGIVAKRADSPYRAGYSADWLKIRVDRAGDFAVVGFDPGPGGFRNLHLAVCDGGRLTYIGTVGTGFGSEEMREIHARLETARRAQPAAAGAPAGRGPVWVEPEMVCEVRFKEWTQGGHLRQPVFLRLRDDKTVDECLVPGFLPEPESEPEAPAAVSPKLTNLGKVFWPEEGYTKGDLIEYYRAVAPWFLPYLADRPLVLDRYPNGIHGKSFFQKNAPAGSGMRTMTIRSDGSQRDIEYFLCDTAESLLYLVNLGVIPFHIWSSRVTALEQPDWCILDLDPKGAPFADVVRIAREIHDLCEEIELESFVKTSGGSGIHILLPMGGQLAHEPVRQLAELMAQVIVHRLPQIATTARAIAARGGKVYVDALQNGRGKLLAAPFSVRPRPGATASTPLRWNEVGPRLDIGAFNLRTVPQRLRKMKADPLLPVLSHHPDLARSLALLMDLV
ncbi:MAG TPA: DNA ligase D [Thermoanaerobaculia bacterium]|nr:DNA ligase D [Thermoanaerobaculia bacterium]